MFSSSLFLIVNLQILKMNQREIDNLLRYFTNRGGTLSEKQAPPEVPDDEKADWIEWADTYFEMRWEAGTVDHISTRKLYYRPTPTEKWYSVINYDQLIQFLIRFHGNVYEGEHFSTAKELGQKLRRESKLVPEMNSMIRQFLELSCADCYTLQYSRLLTRMCTPTPIWRSYLRALTGIDEDPNAPVPDFGCGRFSSVAETLESSDGGNTFFRCITSALGKYYPFAHLMLAS